MLTSIQYQKVKNARKDHTIKSGTECRILS